MKEPRLKLHKSGKRYRWAVGRSVWDIPLPPVPQAILEALQPTPLPTMAARPAKPASSGAKPADAGMPPSTEAFLAGQFKDGPNWNDRLFRAACDLAGRGMPVGEAEPLLLAGAQPWNAEESAAARRTIESAFSRPRRAERLPRSNSS